MVVNRRHVTFDVIPSDVVASYMGRMGKIKSGARLS